MNSEIMMSDSEETDFPLILKKAAQSKKDCFRRNLSVQQGENRIMSKRGRINIYLNKIPEKSIRYVRDLWNTLVNMRWRYIMFTVGLVNVSAYLLFAVFFLFDAWISGDFDDLEDHKTCINGINQFTSFFMLGIETITTTGYGYFHPTEYCKLVFVILTCSTLVMIFIDGAFISVVYVKFGRPTLAPGIFSKKAIISLRDGKLCLIFRINDQTGKHCINSRINLYLIKDEIVGENLTLNYIHELQVQPYGMLFWPIYIVHEITASSPLWNTSASDLMSSSFEILAVVSGSSIQSGQPSRSQTSYLSKEILWGFRFNPCVKFRNSDQQYVVDRKQFNQTIAYDAPLCNARWLSNFQKELNRRRGSIGGYASSECEPT